MMSCARSHASDRPMRRPAARVARAGGSEALAAPLGIRRHAVRSRE